MGVMVWVIVGAVLAVAEIFTATLFLLMFSVGAVAAAGAAALGAPVALQAVVFVAVSAATLAVVRPALRRHLNRPGGVSMGMESMQGASAVVVEHVSADEGMVTIGGELWQARSLETPESFAPGERVVIVDVREGVVVVWREDLADPAGHQL